MKSKKYLGLIPVLLFSSIALTGLVGCGERTMHPSEGDEGETPKEDKLISLITNNDTVVGGRIEFEIFDKDGNLVPESNYDKIELYSKIVFKGITCDAGYEIESLYLKLLGPNVEAEIEVDTTLIPTGEVSFDFDIKGVETVILTSKFIQTSSPEVQAMDIIFTKVPENSNEKISDFTDFISDPANIVNTIGGDNTYGGQNGPRIGSAKNGGSIQVSLKESIKIDSINLEVEKYNNDTSSCKILLDNNVSKEISSLKENQDNIATFDGVETRSITISVPKASRVYLKTIHINGTAGGEVNPNPNPDIPVDPDTPVDPEEKTGFVTTSYEGQGSVTLNKKYGKVGETIQVTAVPSSGYKLTSCTLNGKAIAKASENVYSFKLGENENKIHVIFTKTTNPNPNPTPTPDHEIMEYFESKEVYEMATRGAGDRSDVDQYYSGITNQVGEDLKYALYDLCQPKERFTYDDLKRTYPDTDYCVDDPSSLYLFYTGEHYSIADFKQRGWSYINREHVWPNSRGAGKSGPGSDKHMLRPCEQTINSTRGSMDFGVVVGGKELTGIKAGNKTNTKQGKRGYFEPKDEFKGDVARTIFYLATVYSQMELERPADTSAFNYWTSTYSHGNFEDLYNWATDPTIDPVSANEMNRNNLIDSLYQHNRNPFVDHPEYIERIYSKNFQFK